MSLPATSASVAKARSFVRLVLVASLSVLLWTMHFGVGSVDDEDEVWHGGGGNDGDDDGRRLGLATLLEERISPLAMTRTKATTTTHTYSPSVAAYVSSSSPDASLRLSPYVKVDGSRPGITVMTYLRFEGLLREVVGASQGKVEKVELSLRCADGFFSPGGIVHLGSEAVSRAVTWNTRPSKERYHVFNRLATIGRVREGRTYAIDVSGVIDRGEDEDEDEGVLPAELNLVILPDGESGAAYAKADIQLVVTVRDDDRGVVGGGTRIGPFQIMLYHDPSSYLWQGNSDPRAYCVDCSDDLKKPRRSRDPHCEEGDYLQVRECDDDVERQWWYYEGGTFRPYRDADRLCWDYRGSGQGPYYRLRRCGSSDDQTFGSGGPGPDEVRNQDDAVHGETFNVDGNYKSRRFELYPLNRSRKCVTQSHHPKKGEELMSQLCKKARRHDTSYWVATSPPSWSGHSLDG